MPFAMSTTTARLLILAFIAGYVRAQVEVQVDDNDPNIVYTPAVSWFRNTEPNPMDAGGFHMVTTDSAASATFRFTGTGISYMAPLWADIITTQVRLDGGIPVVIDLQDKTVPAETDGATTVESSVLWSERGLANVEHTLVIDVPPGGGFAVVDMLVIEQEEVTDTTSSTDEPLQTTTSTSSTPTSTASTSTTSIQTVPPVATSPIASPTPATKAGLTIAIAVVCGVAGLLIILGLILFLARRRRQRREREAWNKMNPPPPAPPMDVIDDSINAPPKQRFRSIPSRESVMKMYDDNSPDNMSQVTSPTASGKGASKLRQVVATDDGNARQSWMPQGSMATRT